MLIIPDFPEDARERELVNKVLSHSDNPIFAFGRNEHSENLCGQIQLDGFIDDFATCDTHLGKPVHRLAEIPKNAIVVSCVTAIQPLTAKRRLLEFEITSAIHYLDLCRLKPNRFPPITPIRQTREDFAVNRSKYEWVHGLLEDDESKRTFEKLLFFRLTGDLRHMDGFKLAIQDQYFGDFFDLGSNETFIDGGGFDGDTALEFIKRCPDYRAIHFFEPSPKAMQLAQQRLLGFSNISFHQSGLYSSSGTMHFNSDLGSASQLSDSGTTAIRVEKIDEAVSGEVTFIKLDIEGAELECLKGASSNILRHCPRLAIAVYHHPSDFWRIPELVLSLRSDYNVFLRHYTEGWTETVMFFLPSSR